jgi:hypothetical protein
MQRGQLAAIVGVAFINAVAIVPVFSLIWAVFVEPRTFEWDVLRAVVFGWGTCAFLLCTALTCCVRSNTFAFHALGVVLGMTCGVVCIGLTYKVWTLLNVLLLSGVPDWQGLLTLEFHGDYWTDIALPFLFPALLSSSVMGLLSAAMLWRFYVRRIRSMDFHTKIEQG